MSGASDGGGSGGKFAAPAVAARNGLASFGELVLECRRQRISSCTVVEFYPLELPICEVDVGNQPLSDGRFTAEPALTLVQLVLQGSAVGAKHFRGSPGTQFRRSLPVSQPTAPGCCA